MLFWPPKDPDEILDYDIDWSGRLDTDDAIASSTWTIIGDVAEQSATFTTNKTKIWLTGGTLNTTSKLTNEIQTTAGRQMDQTVGLTIKSK